MAAFSEVGARISFRERFFSEAHGAAHLSCVTPRRRTPADLGERSQLRVSALSWPYPSWATLAAQFGGNYAEVRKFKRDFLRELARVIRDAYPAAKVDVTAAGLVLRPSKRAVPSKSS